MRRTLSRAGLVLLSAALLTSPTAAFAQPPPPDGAASSPEEAKRLGDEAMVALRYEDALAYYRRAYDANTNPALLYNTGRAYEGLADFPKALDALEEFSEKAPPTSRRASRSKRVATVIVSCPVAGAEVRLGNKVVGATREGQTILRVNAGAQVMSVSHRDFFPFEKPLALAAGKIETVDAQLSSRSAGGLIVVTSPILGAQVSVDGVSSGNVPAEVPAKPGPHRVSLRKDGYDPAEQSVVVIAGERKPIILTMSLHETIAGKWWFWTSIGVVVSAAAAITVVAVTKEKPPDSGTIPPGTVKAETFGFRF